MYTELRSVGIRLSASWNQSTNTVKDCVCFLSATYAKWVCNSCLLVNWLQVISYFSVFFLHFCYEFVGWLCFVFPMCLYLESWESFWWICPVDLKDLLIRLNGLWCILWKYQIPCSASVLFPWPYMETMAWLWEMFLLIHSTMNMSHQ